MYILKVGLTHETAPVDIREKLAFSDDQLEDAMLRLNEQKSVMENVIISTCNRMEVYAVVDQIHTGRHYVTQFLANWFGLAKKDFESYLQILDNDQAIEHLFLVATGLNSMVLGETQILGQVRNSFLTAQRLKTTGTMFNELFKRAVTLAKRAHRETSIGEQAVSISYAAVELAKKIFGGIENKHVVILGAGEMGELAVKNLHGAGATKVTVVNRTLETAEQLAVKFNATAKQSNQLLSVLEDADILISSTGSSIPVLTKEQIIPIQKARRGNPLFMVDIAVPRDIDSAVSELDSVFLYDIDDLQHIVDDNMKVRKEAAIEINAMIGEELCLFTEWVTTLGVVPVISALREKALTIQQETMDSIKRKIPDLTEREQKVLNKHTKSIINQLLKQPITEAKEMGSLENAEEQLALFIDVFGLGDDVKDKVKNQIKNNKSILKSGEMRRLGIRNAFR